MEAYTGFAGVYDKFMDGVPYGQWCENVVCELEKYGINDGIVLELGCGTGNLTQLLAAKGYDMIGVDCSDAMLNIACEKREKSGHDILYLYQDMTMLELYGTVRAVVSVCDSLNYLVEDEELITCFGLVNNYLDPGGIFIFDFNTRYKYETVIGNRVIAENRDDCSFIWENYFDSENGINVYELTVFARDDDACAAGRELFSRFEEYHMQRGYTLDEMRHFIEVSGLKFCRAYDADTLGEVTEESGRIYCVAQEKRKDERELKYG